MSAAFDQNIADQVQQHVTLKEVTADKRAIEAKIDAGWEIPGAELAIGKYSLVRK
jgi:hypothetical protein